MRETNHKDAQTFIQEWETAADKSGASSKNTASFIADEGWRAAFHGDGKAANAFFERAIDMGYRDPLFLQQNYRLPRADNGELDGSITKMLLAINAERTKLDMAPLTLNEYK